MMTSAVMSKPSLLKATPPTLSARRGRSSAPFLVRAEATALGGMVPDQNKRNLMNYALLGAAALPIGSMVGAYGSFLVPPSAGGGSGGSRAKDALGNDIKATAWLADHPPKDYSLVQGLQAEPTYLIVTEDGNIQNYGVNSICTHLGCVVPWVAAENKFKCPCHGSQYDKEGKVIRGPAPLSLALAHASVDADDKVSLTPWTETDFRTGEEPWWK